MKQRRMFSTEFKHDAAVLVLEQGYTYSAACQAVVTGPMFFVFDFY